MKGTCHPRFGDNGHDRVARFADSALFRASSCRSFFTRIASDGSRSTGRNPSARSRRLSAAFSLFRARPTSLQLTPGRVLGAECLVVGHMLAQKMFFQDLAATLEFAKDVANRRRSRLWCLTSDRNWHRALPRELTTMPSSGGNFNAQCSMPNAPR
jgi:hypothetical protein